MKILEGTTRVRTGWSCEPFFHGLLNSGDGFNRTQNLGQTYPNSSEHKPIFWKALHKPRRDVIEPIRFTI